MEIRHYPRPCVIRRLTEDIEGVCLGIEMSLVFIERENGTVDTLDMANEKFLLKFTDRYSGM
jgi:hypothetical protein